MKSAWKTTNGFGCVAVFPGHISHARITARLCWIRPLADARIFPAINLLASGTRKEELLYTENEMRGLAALQRRLANLEPKAAMLEILKLIESVPTSAKLLQESQPKS